MSNTLSVLGTRGERKKHQVLAGNLLQARAALAVALPAPWVVTG